MNNECYWEFRKCLSDKHYWGFTIRTIFQNCYRIFLFLVKKRIHEKKDTEKKILKISQGWPFWLSVEVSVWVYATSNIWTKITVKLQGNLCIGNRCVRAWIFCLLISMSGAIGLLSQPITMKQFSQFNFVRFCVKHVLKHACINSVGRTQRKLNFVCRKVVKYPTCGNHLHRSKKIIETNKRSSNWVIWWYSYLFERNAFGSEEIFRKLATAFIKKENNEKFLLHV